MVKCRAKINIWEGDLFLYDGLKQEDLSEDDKRYIADIVNEDVFIDAWHDGTPYIDD